MLCADNITLGDRLDGVSAGIAPGRITAICGPNGAGKSSLLSVLAGLIAPDAGAAELDTTPTADLSPRARARAKANPFGDGHGVIRFRPHCLGLVVGHRRRWPKPALQG